MAAPFLVAAAPNAISGAASLVGSLLGISSQEEQERKRRLQEMEQNALNRQMDAQKGLTEGQQAAMARLMDSFQASVR